jgi:hypothetical protein
VDDPSDSPYEICTLVWCPEHVEKVDKSTLTHDWRPSDPARMLIPKTPDEAKYRVHLAQTLSQRTTYKAYRTGTFTVFNIGVVKYESRFFHSHHHIFPRYFKASRIYWSMAWPLRRTSYLLEILSDFDFEDTSVNVSPIFESNTSWDRYWYPLRSQPLVDSKSISEKCCRATEPIDFSKHRPVFRVIIGDNAENVLLVPSLDLAYQLIMSGVCAVNVSIRTSMAARKDGSRGAYTGPQFFGLGLPYIKHAIELRPESVSCGLLASPLPQYEPCFVLHKAESMRRMQLALKHLRELNKTSKNGAARAEPYIPRVASENATGYKNNKTLTKIAGSDKKEASSAGLTEGTDLSTAAGDEEAQENHRAFERNRLLYEELSTAYLANPIERLMVKRSSIHGWGLFARAYFPKDSMIVEYIGERVRQVVGDRREALYEAEGVGSCYLFRLDRDVIVDATRRGGMARFMNHCCEPNAYARIIATDELQQLKHIVIFALRDIEVSMNICSCPFAYPQGVCVGRRRNNLRL